mgnify:CR=1 FL=1
MSINIKSMVIEELRKTKAVMSEVEMRDSVVIMKAAAFLDNNPTIDEVKDFFSLWRKREERMPRPKDFGLFLSNRRGNERRSSGSGKKCVADLCNGEGFILLENQRGDEFCAMCSCNKESSKSGNILKIPIGITSFLSLNSWLKKYTNGLAVTAWHKNNVLGLS